MTWLADKAFRIVFLALAYSMFLLIVIAVRDLWRAR